MSGGARLDGKVVVVAGASRGIGAACAVACARAGASRVVMLARDAGALERVAGEVSAAGAEAEPLRCDVSSPGDIRAAFDAVERVDVLIDSAGINRPEPLEVVTRRRSTGSSRSTCAVRSSSRRRPLSRCGGGARAA